MLSVDTQQSIGSFSGGNEIRQARHCPAPRGSALAVGSLPEFQRSFPDDTAALLTLKFHPRARRFSADGCGETIEPYRFSPTGRRSACPQMSADNAADGRTVKERTPHAAVVFSGPPTRF